MTAWVSTSARRTTAAVAVLSAVAGCSGASSSVRGSDARVGVAKKADAHPNHAKVPHTPSAEAPARSHEFASLAHAAIGPFAARAGDRRIAAWIAPSSRGDLQDLVVAPLASDGAPLAQVRVVAHVPRDSTSLDVRPLGGTSGGWLLAWTALLDRGESLSVLGLADDGTPRGEPVELQRTSDHLKWAGLVPVPRGAICVWAEETSSGLANILAAPVDGQGKPRGLPVRIAASVARWQAVTAGDGAALALVEDRTLGDGSTTATLTWQRLDADAHPQETPAIIAQGAVIGSDLEVVPIREGWILAWTDRTTQDAQVVLALVDDAGHSRGPMPALNKASGSALVALASGPKGVAMAWQEPGRSTRENRTVHLALVSTSGSLAAHPVTSMEIAAASAPEFVATETGFALLGRARACTASPPSPCEGPVVPTFIRMDAALEPVQTEPIFLGNEARAASLGWGLQCDARDRCVAFAATDESPTRVFAVDLAPRTSPYAAPLPALPPADVPRVTGIATVAAGEQYDDVAAARIGGGSVVAMLSGGRSGSDTRGRIRGNRIALRFIDELGQPRPGSATLTTWALATGGVAMAAGSGTPAGPVAVAWVAPEGGDPHVFVASIDEHGRTSHQVRVTSGKSDASNVAIAWAGDGWILAWVDARDGNGEVYAAKVDRELKKVGHDERLRHAPGDAADVTLAVRGSLAWVAWSDPRESPREGAADIYATTLHASNATRAGVETRVLSTARHSRSPKLAATIDGGALVVWIEDAPTGLEGPSTAVVARLDGAARAVGAAHELPLAGGGRPTAIDVAKLDEGVEVILVRSALAGVTLDAMRLGDDGAILTKAWPLVDLDAPASFDVALAVSGDGLVFDDVGVAPGERRVRRASIRWGR